MAPVVLGQGYRMQHSFTLLMLRSLGRRCSRTAWMPFDTHPNAKLIAHAPKALLGCMLWLTAHVLALSWETLQPNGGNQVNVGAIFVGSSPQNFYPQEVTVNGVTCYRQQL